MELALNAGLWVSIMLYRMLAFSVLMFVAQARPIPTHVLASEKRAVMKLACGPYNWLPLTVAFNLDILFNFPSSFPSIEVSGLAAKLRLAIVTIPKFKSPNLALEVDLTIGG